MLVAAVAVRHGDDPLETSGYPDIYSGIHCCSAVVSVTLIVSYNIEILH